MSSTNLLKILLLIFVAFALGEIIFTIQRYGLPQIDLFKPKPGSCRILEKKYCGIAKEITYENIKYLAFNVPDGAPVFAERDGFLDKTADSLGYISVIRDGYGGVNYRGNIKFENLLSKNVKKGEIIGYIDDKKLNLSGYKLLITFAKRTKSGPILDNDTFQNVKNSK